MIDLCEQFKKLHHQDKILFLGNVHDIPSAMLLEAAGFKALATTSWGVSNMFGYKDGENLNFQEYLDYTKKIINSVKLPVSFDIEAGYANNIDQIVQNVLSVANIGAVGINIEDSPKHIKGLQKIEQHCRLLTAIKEALIKQGFDNFYINARTDTYLQQVPSALKETIERGQAYAKHGADGLFVPGIVDRNEIQDVVKNVSLPLNVVSLPNLSDLKELSQLGVKRLSYGNALSDLLIAQEEQITRDLFNSQSTLMLYSHPDIAINFKVRHEHA